MSLIPILALGFVLARVLQAQIVTRAVADASQSAQLLARIGIQPRLTPADLRSGLSPGEVGVLDRQLSARSATRDLARIKIWNTRHVVIYSDDHTLIGHAFAPSDDLRNALAGRSGTGQVVNPSPHAETASEVGLGELVEVYVPLRFSHDAPPAGAFEIYLSYRPIAAAIARDKRTIGLLVFCGLALLWAILFRIVAGASRTLRHQARENSRLARYDDLTGLPNRTLFLEETSAVLRRERSRGGAMAVLLLDLDGFKEINDTLGHSTGDIVLCEIGRRLRALADLQSVARLAGDEYAVVHPCSIGPHGISQALVLASEVQASLEAPVELDGVALNVDASIGLALAPQHADDLDALLRRADVALDRAKSNRSRLEVYSPEYDHFDAARLTLLGQVRPALERGEFILHYQPQADLRTGRIIGVEALLRWQHPERGLVPPLQFIPLIEQTALVGPVTMRVLDLALEQLARWRDHGIHLAMSVNLSARNLLDPELPRRVSALLGRHAVPAHRLTVEVTEGATMADPEQAVNVLRELRALGVSVSIDDFGSGHASMAYLTTLPASELKIDRSFVTDMCQSPREEAIVRATVDLARHLNLHVVAEGIETREVWDRLAELGCDTAQGYLLSRPLPPEELSAWLQERAERPSATTSPARREGQADDTQGRPGAIHAAQE
ncbi:MAG TPA: bifunctional diguanylate cyclase/phosphodiesterase [Solirubrobacteraceae bacterium]|nr:bifunctional diguanylate cyclase/phosphodiesterase [Solirubrobacteraceae bacterium]